MARLKKDERLVEQLADDGEERFCWLVIFSEGEKPYLYLYRSMSYMAAEIKQSYDRHQTYPHRMWVIVKGETQLVEVK